MLRNTLLRLMTGVILVGALLVVTLAAMVPSSDSATPDPVTITDYTATYDVSADGTLQATEEITGDFPIGRHGIFRYWDLADFADRTVRYRPRDVKITLDGQAVPSEAMWEQGRRYRVAKIGDPDTYLSQGQHTYRISYRIDGVLGPNPGDPTDGNASWSSADPNRSEFVWQVVAAGWRMSIARAAITVNLPASADRSACAVQDGQQCTVTDGGNRSYALTAENLQPFTPVTFRAAMELPVPDRAHVPWSVGWDRLLSSSTLAAVVSLALAVLAGLLGWWAARTTRERVPGFPVLFEPPAGLGPVQTFYVAHEVLPPRALSATLMYLAEKKLVTLSQSGKDWTLTGDADDAAWDAVDPVSQAVGDHLGLRPRGATFAADGSVSAGKVLSTLNAKIATTTKHWGASSNSVVTAGNELLWRGAFGAAVILVFFGVFTGALGIWLFPFVGFAIGAAPVLRQGVGRRRTETGRDLWSRAGGFERFLSTDSAQDRFDFSGREQLYTDFIPYAVAFGVADRWARKYEVSTGQTAPMPLWYGGGTSTGGTGFFGGNDAFTSFESALSSSISSYQATQSSSSSGGGGGFSGGGGGGGGGGSW